MISNIPTNPDDFAEWTKSGINDTTTTVSQSAQNDGISQSSQSQSEQPMLRKAFSHRSDDEISEKPNPIPYIIKGFIRAKGLHMLYGESGCGKGFCILDMCESIARYEIDSWHGHQINHGDVIYFCGESADGLNARIKVWKDTHGIKEKGANFEIIDEIFHIDEADKKSDYYIDNVIANIKALSENPALVVIDPINIYMGGDENSAHDTGIFISACRKIISECGCSVLFVQHVGLNPDAKTRARGSSAFYAGVDIALQLKKNNNVLTLSTTKKKEGKIEPNLIFNLTEHVIEGWFDEDNEPITSCTLELAEKLMEYREKQTKERNEPKLSQPEKFARKTYLQAARNFGRIIVDDETTGHETIRIDVEDWRKTFYEMSTADTDNAKRMAFKRAKKALAETKNTLTIKHERGYEYYCLDLSNDNIEPAYRLEIRTAIKNREKQEAMKSAKRRAFPFFSRRRLTMRHVRSWRRCIRI